MLRTGLLATGPNRFGVLTVAAAARTWERLSAPVRVSWFPEGDRLEALVKPTPGTTIEPTTPIELTFSQPVKAVLGVTRPKLDPPTPGIWSQTSAEPAHVQADGSGFALGRQVVVTLPAATDILSPGKTQTAATLTWSVPVGSTVRLHQLLAELGYLPLTWAAEGRRGGRQRGGPEGGCPPRAAREASRGASRNTPAELPGALEADGLDADDPGRRDGVPGRPRARRRRDPRADDLAHADPGRARRAATRGSTATSSSTGASRRP